MIRTVKIENFKSISKLEFELGRFNVFIGENGSGKSNLLEAFAMASAAHQGTLLPETLYAKGIRVTKPTITFSAFKDTISNPIISMEFEFFNRGLGEIHVQYPVQLKASNPVQIEASWINLDEQHIQAEREKIESKLQELRNRVAKIKELQNGFDDEVVDIGRGINEVEQLEKELNPVLAARISLYPATLYFKDFVIFALNIPALRGIVKDSLTQPLGIHGENLDVHIAQLSPEDREQLRSYYKYIQWLDEIEVDVEEKHKTEGYKLGKSTSQLYFADRFLKEANNLMSAESANEGVLFLLFYLVLFLSPHTPRFFAIDNIEQALNPRLARVLIKELARLAKEKNKQALITTHDPAVLDGMNLYDDEQRLFVVSRADDGATTVNRVKLNGESKREFKLSEMWMRGSLGAVPTTF